MRTLLFILIVILPLQALGADPQPSTDGKDQARSLFGLANKAYKKGQYGEALKLYRRANTIFPSYKIQLNIGETLESMGRSTEAAVVYHRFLDTFKDAPRPARRDAWLRLSGLRRWLTRVKVICTEQGAQVKVNDLDQGMTPLSIPIYLEHGKYTITLEKDGFEPVTRDVHAHRGGHQAIRVTLKRPVALPDPAPAQPCPKTTCPPCHDDALRRAHRSMTIGGYVSLGTGLALVASAAVLYGVGGARGAEAYDLYSDAQDPAAMSHHYDDVQDARALLMAGHGFMGAGLVAVGLSIYQFLARPELPAQSVVGVAPLSGGATLSVGGRF